MLEELPRAHYGVALKKLLPVRDAIHLAEV